MFLSIDIGSRHIHLVEGEYKNKKVRLNNLVTILTPEGTMGDGEILNTTDLIIKLRNAIYQHQIKAKKAIVTINPASVISRTFTIPQVKPKEILPVLSNHISATLSLNEAYVVDYTRVSKGEDNTLEIDTLALPVSVVQTYREIVEGIHMKPCAMELHQNSMAKYVATCDEIDNRNVIVADIGNSFINLYYFKKKTMEFSRRSIINTEEYETTLVSLGCIKSLNNDFKDLNFSPQALGTDPLVENTMNLYLNNIMEQIQRVVEFQSSRGRESRVEAIYICGGMANMKGIDEYLAMQLELPVARLETINTIRDRKLSHVGDYAMALGALMREK